MKNFFFKKSEVILDCFTCVPHVYDFAKINNGSKFIPDWWKETPPIVFGDNREIGTIKNCVGLIDFYKKSIVIPSWFELDLNICEKNHPDDHWYSVRSSTDSVSTAFSHSPHQFEKFARATGKNVKLTSPWAFRTREDIYFTWTQPTWNMRDILSDLTLLPAVVNYKYQHTTNINYLIDNHDQPRTVTIPALTPLAILHPLTEKNVIIKNHLVSEQEYTRIFGVEKLALIRNPKEMNQGYYKRKDLLNKAESLSKCPFTNKD
jgi:hypothetical protein